MSRLALFLAFMFVACSAFSQKLPQLKIGDTLPDVVFTQVINYDKSTLKLSDFKGKKILLDFWNRWCSACISNMPKIENLQKDLSTNNIIILPISSDNLSQFQTLKKNSAILQKITLPMVFGDTLLWKLLEIPSVPYYVWLNENLKIIDKTPAYLVTKENLLNFSGGGSLGSNYIRRYDESSIINSHLLQETKTSSYHSMLFKDDKAYYLPIYLPGVKSVKDSLLSSDIKTVKIVDYPLVRLFALGENFRDVNNVIAPDSLMYPANPDSLVNWYKRNCYRYEIYVPKDSSRAVSKYLKADLERHFKLQSRVELLEKRVYLLKKKRTFVRSSANRPGDSSVIVETQQDRIRLQNAPLFYLAEELEKQLRKENSLFVPVILDEKGIDSVTIEIPLPLKSISELNSFLSKNGFEIAPSKRKIKTLMIENRNALPK